MNQIVQVDVDIMSRQFKIGAPAEEKETLIQAIDLLNQKIKTVKESGKIVESDKILIMAALNVVHDLLKMSMQNGLAIGEFERKINDMLQVSERALAKLPNTQE
ncbi:cell division protein ZapA [Neisseria wadsworthii]|uniref:Cell division protein ZapA n=1 Tax=Neisseria wadsworthii 9715 TaxID=1030841 RepID=G4CT94_9NEIS|nr:cell division protein ZapA [Neisseria wadsworthii]EGZ44326.1 cell division protein ZapA [Neisseria wadsworthii 9715]QMT35889.1 cell division protein ZapA [Neisseria wadsworthii]